MEVVIVGPGALGCLLAAHLARFNRVRLFDHNPVRAALLENQGVVLESDDGISVLPVYATADPEAVVAADLVLLCVKSPKITEAVGRIRPFLARSRTAVDVRRVPQHL